MPSIIVDTSQWVQYFRLPDSDEATEVRRLIEADEVYMVGIVYAELVRGARNDRQLQTTRRILDALPYLEVTLQTWQGTGGLLALLQRQGQRIPIADALIAALALQHEISVYTRDEHFQRVPELDLHQPKP